MTLQPIFGSRLNLIDSEMVPSLETKFKMNHILFDDTNSLTSLRLIKQITFVTNLINTR